MKGLDVVMKQIFPVRIFFDESGKNTDKIHLMGALLIPEKVYAQKELQRLNELIKKNNIHWTDYSGHGSTRRNIEKILTESMEYHNLMKMNIISYNQNKIQEDSIDIKPDFDEIVDRTIYTKFPERVVYGLIRKYGSHTLLDAKVYIEHDNTYEAKNYDLSKQMFEQLNIQSVYRGENYKLSHVGYLTKKQEYGIELTDLMLGVVRTIIENNNTSKRKRAKNELVMELLKISNVYDFLVRIKLFEWGKANQLIDTPIKNYIDIFMSEQGDIEM